MPNPESGGYTPEVMEEKDLSKSTDYPGDKAMKEMFVEARETHSLLNNLSQELDEAGQGQITPRQHLRWLRFLTARDLTHERNKEESALNEEEKGKIALWEIYKNFRIAKVGRENREGSPGSSVLIDAIHANPPSQQEALMVMEELIPNIDRRIYIEAYNIADMERLQKIGREEAITMLQDRFKGEIDESIASTLIEETRKLLSRFETRTSKAAITAAEESGASCFIPRSSRVGVDLNRDYLEEGIKELGYSALQAERDFILTCAQETSEIDEDGRIARPFLHLSIHGMKKSENGVNFVIANGMKVGKMPCDPRIARWVKKEIEEAIADLGLKNGNGDPGYSVDIAEEGDEFSGSEINNKRRWGDSENSGLGENYNHVQIETSTDVRKDGDVLARIIDRISKRFQQEFLEKGSVDRLPLAESDKHRLQGELYQEKVGRNDREETDIIWLSQAFRTALGVTTKDRVEIVGKQYKVRKPSPAQVNERKVILSKKVNIEEPIVIKKV